MKITQENGATICDLESDGAFSAFRMGQDDHRQWSRHPETQELNNYMSANGKSEHVYVRYEGASVRVRP
jgi:hypothetical protein